MTRGIIAWGEDLSDKRYANKNSFPFPVIESDHIYLDIKETTLPNSDLIGKGVFAKSFIPNGNIICEYRGFVATEKDILASGISVDRNKGFMTTFPDGGDALIFGTGICPIINDCAYIIGNKDLDDIRKIQMMKDNKQYQLPCCPGYEYNAMPSLSHHKVFIVASATA